MFKLGDYVEWIDRREPPMRGATGKIVAIIPSDTGTPEFDLYDVEFPFGTRTLYGAQLTLKESGRPESD